MTEEKTCQTCGDSSCSAQARRPGDEDYRDRQRLLARMCRVEHKVLVLSGKGGVGKSTVAVNLATALALAGKRVGLLDVDIHGPSVPKLLGLEGSELSGTDGAILPVRIPCGAGELSVMSIGFLLRERDDAVIWRGPRKYGAIKQFLTDVEWGDLDYLVVDSPPGTGDEPLAVAQLLEKADGAVVVTTPQEIAVQDVRRCVVFCRQIELPVLGVVENMSGFTCPRCGEAVGIFGKDGGRGMAAEMGVPLGAIPTEIVLSGDGGRPIVMTSPHSESAKAFGRIVRVLLEPELGAQGGNRGAPVGPSGERARIAVPVTGGVLSSHFGHCEQFLLFDVEADGTTVGRRQELSPPPHEPGAYPQCSRSRAPPSYRGRDGLARAEPVRAAGDPGRRGGFQREPRGARPGLRRWPPRERRQRLRSLRGHADLRLRMRAVRGVRRRAIDVGGGAGALSDVRWRRPPADRGRDERHRERWGRFLAAVRTRDALLRARDAVRASSLWLTVTARAAVGDAATSTGVIVSGGGGRSRRSRRRPRPPSRGR